LPVVWPAA